MRVVVLDDVLGEASRSADWHRLASRADVDFVGEHDGDPEDAERRIRDADVVVAMRERTQLTRPMLERSSVRLVVTTGMRNASIDPPPELLLCGTRALVSPTVELTWSLLLAGLRHLPSQLSSVQHGGWQTRLGRSLDGATLGILGLGTVGTRVAAVARTFGATVLATGATLTDERAHAAGAERTSLDALFERSSIVSIHARLTDETRGMVDRARLAALGSDGLLVNTARAAIVDQHALVAALSAGALGAAAIDVHDVEPLPGEHPLRAAPNLLLSPHLGYMTRENLELMYGDAVDAIEAWLDGSPIRVIHP